MDRIENRAQKLTKEFNSETYPKISHARSFVSCIDHALQKCDENARRQFECIGWSDEVRETLLRAVDLLERVERDQLRNHLNQVMYGKNN